MSVEVKIYLCRGLRFPEPIGLYDPMVLVQSETQVEQVNLPASIVPKLKNSNPVYNKVLKFVVPNLMGTCIYVTVVDTNDLLQQAILGRVEVPLNRLGAQQSGVELRNLYLLQSGGEVDIGLVPIHPVLVTETNEQATLVRAPTVGPYQVPKKKTLLRNCVQYQPGDLSRIFPHLARGSFGVVFKGRACGIDEIVVIKDMEIQNLHSVDEWRKEIAIMAQNKSPYIAEVFGFCSQGNVLTIVMEYMDCGDLFGILHKKADKYPLSLIQRMRMARHCALGVQVLHKNKIIHRDIKSMNVLVNKDYICKITDFGCSKLSNDYNPFNTVNTGTPLWMAPEVKSGNYGLPSDIYSLGLVLYELFERKLPLYDPNTQVTTLPQQFQSVPVVLPCVNPDPTRRPTIDQLLLKLESLIRRFVCIAQSNLSTEALGLCRKAVQETLTESTGCGTNVSHSEAEAAAVFQYLLDLSISEANSLCGVNEDGTPVSLSQLSSQKQHPQPPSQPLSAESVVQSLQPTKLTSKSHSTQDTQLSSTGDQTVNLDIDEPFSQGSSLTHKTEKNGSKFLSLSSSKKKSVKHEHIPPPELQNDATIIVNCLFSFPLLCFSPSFGGFQKL
eukprot:TRINITY_DN926_c0_g2_i2.p1 TRINITY_DN926_c0_g2~~TRINITY_DN926_c0_g2_i2.p1  ORF type:complete len:611 (-),score=94.52 TRINITY_DN926_c0_g2_i2:554-2386(-)